LFMKLIKKYHYVYSSSNIVYFAIKRMGVMCWTCGTLGKKSKCVL